MTDLLLARSDLFPIGTTVTAHARGSFRAPGVLVGPALESQTVAADGIATFTTLSANTPYVFSDGTVSVNQRLSSHTAGTPWKTRVANRRAAIGTS